MSEAESEFAGIGTAHLSSELDSDGPYTISGVALGAGDVTVGSSGIKKKWPAEELKEAAETLEGQPLVRDHENNTDGRVGTVTEAYYKSGVGVMYEAELAPHYEELAQDIAAGIQEVSARAYHDPVDELEEDEDTGALRTSNVVFDNLSVVSQGAAPSNTAEIGGLDVSGAVAMAQGPTGDAVATLEQGAPRPDGLVDEEENAHPSVSERSDESSMPRKNVGDTPEWNDGDMVRWQVEPDLFGKIVHVDDEKNVAMVEIMGMESGSMESTGFTITAGFSDLKPMTVPESKADMSSDNSSEDDEDMSSGDEEDADVAELKSVAGVTFDGKSGGKLDESTIPNDDYEQHYLFPDDTKSDSSYPVVDGEGNLRAGNVAAAHQLGARGGVSEDSLTEKLMALNKEWPEGERPIDTNSDEEENSAATKDDDAQDEQSTLTVAALSDNTTNTHTTNMTNTIQYDHATEDDIEEMSEPVVIEQDDVESLRDKADEADELSERLDNLNSSLDELADNQEALEDVDEDRLNELREYDEAVVLTEDEHEELQGLVDDIGGVFAEELAEYSAFEAEELQERFTPLELRDKVESHDEASVESELGESTEDPEPEGGSADPEELSGDGGDAEQEATEEEVREVVAEHLEEGGLNRQAEKVREGDIALDEMGIDVESVVAE